MPTFPFCTIDPTVGTVAVPDYRFDALIKFVQPVKTMPAIVEFVDIAGLVKGASEGQGLGNQFLANIRETEAIVHVVRCFDDPDIVHVEGDVDPLRDIETIEIELILKDLDTVQKQIQKWSKQLKGGEKEAQKQIKLLTKVEGLLENQQWLSHEMDEDELDEISNYQFLSTKPVLFVCNVAEPGEENDHVAQVRKLAEGRNAEVVVLSAQLELEISELSNEEQLEFLEDYGLTESGLNQLIKHGYHLLGLITYFTAGVKEVRAWTITRGMKAPQAAGKIHTDFEKGFIRAEVMSYADWEKFGGETKVKEAGAYRVEGKEYVTLDGDIMHFRFNV